MFWNKQVQFGLAEQLFGQTDSVKIRSAEVWSTGCAIKQDWIIFTWIGYQLGNGAGWYQFIWDHLVSFKNNSQTNVSQFFLSTYANGCWLMITFYLEMLYNKSKTNVWSICDFERLINLKDLKTFFYFGSSLFDWRQIMLTHVTHLECNVRVPLFAANFSWRQSRIRLLKWVSNFGGKFYSLKFELFHWDSN